MLKDRQFPTQQPSPKRQRLNEKDDVQPTSETTKRTFSTALQWYPKLEEKRKQFGIETFRKNQREAINAALSGNDVLLVMKPGSGKSLVYQLAAAVSGGITVVVTPLISVIHDQMRHCPLLKSIHVPFVDDESTSCELKDVADLSLLFVTPEVFACQKFVDQIDHLCEGKFITRFVIDEVHRISNESHEYKKEYTLLSSIKQFWNMPIIAMTSTANKHVQEDIIKSLSMCNCSVFTDALDLPNLCLEYKKKGNSPEVLCKNISEFIKKNYPDGSGIIYCFSQKETEKMALLLHGLGLESVVYHGSFLEKELSFKRWTSGEVKIIVATSASFGLGISKPDVRYVIHCNLPASLEEYYQQIGRAGHDGQMSHCIIYFNYSDKPFPLSRIQSEDVTTTQQKQRTSFYKMISYLENDIDCRHSLLMEALGQPYEPCNKNCDNCRSRGEKEIISKDFTTHARNLLQIIKAVGDGEQSMSYCIKVWRGNKEKDIVAKKHHNLPQHGTGKKLTEHQNTRLAGILLAQNYIYEESISRGMGKGYYCRVSLTAEKAKEILESDAKVTMTVSQLPRRSDEPKTVFPKRSAVQTLLGASPNSKIQVQSPQKPWLSPKASPNTQVQKSPQQLTPSRLQRAFTPVDPWRGQLLELRARLAQEKGIMAQIIFSDKALDELSMKQPTTVDGLLELSHLTKSQAKQHGLEILKIFRHHKTCPDDEQKVQNQLCDIRVALPRILDYADNASTNSMRVPVVKEENHPNTSDAGVQDTSGFADFLNDTSIDDELDRLDAETKQTNPSPQQPRRTFKFVPIPKISDHQANR